MAKVPLPLKRFLLVGNRRWYTIEAESAAVQSAASAVRKPMDSAAAAAPETEVAEKQKEGFWMKDPKTGNWIPEAHFEDIDVAALREKLLPAGKHPF